MNQSNVGPKFMQDQPTVQVLKARPAPTNPDHRVNLPALRTTSTSKTVDQQFNEIFGL